MPRRFLDTERRQRLALVVASLVAGLALAELGLAVDGRYNSLVSRELVSSPAIWEPTSEETENEQHPDLKLKVEIRLDSQGVRNHSGVSTEMKREIIAFFGDSFTDNRRIDDQFTFTSLLDGIAEEPARVVSYGVDGYGLDQAYLRYRKYEAHDIRHVVYLFCANDLPNLYETNLVEVRDARLVFRQPGPRLFYRLLGRVRLTYLAMGVSRRLWGKSRDVLNDEQLVRFHDDNADAVVREFLSSEPTWTVQLGETFVRLLQQWQDEVEARGRTFTVLVLPREVDTAVAMKLLRPFGGRVIYLRRYLSEEMATFVNDGHWNEYGNLQAALVLAQLDNVPFHRTIGRRELLIDTKRRIDHYYDEHR